MVSASSRGTHPSRERRTTGGRLGATETLSHLARSHTQGYSEIPIFSTWDACAAASAQMSCSAEQKKESGGLLAGRPTDEVRLTRRMRLLVARQAGNGLAVGQAAEKSELEVCVTPDLHLDRHRRTTRKWRRPVGER